MERRHDVERFRGLIASRLGLSLDDSRLDDLGGVLDRRLHEIGGALSSTYLDRLALPSARAELAALAERLTVGETYFFRHFDQFRALVDTALPERLRRNATARQLRLVSAGCSTGEEAYSLALMLRERFPELAAWRVRIDAFDVNPHAIARAKAGVYSRWAFRETPNELLGKYFVARGPRALTIDRGAVEWVSFHERNLLDDDPGFWTPGAFDVVFCRNVTMYFGLETTRAVVARVTNALRAGGFLFLGHAETLRGISHAYHLRHTHDTFYYQRREDDAANDALPAAPCDGSWVDVIERASDRVRVLTHLAEPPPAARWDHSAVLELVRAERFADALALLHQAPAGATLHPDAQLLFGVLLTNCGRLAEAEGLCRQLLTDDELNAGPHYLLAVCCEHAGRIAESVEHARTATYLDPDFAMPRLHLGRLARRAGDRDAATRELTVAATLLAREDAVRVLFFGGGFSREALVALCRAELAALGGRS